MGIFDVLHFINIIRYLLPDEPANLAGPAPHPQANAEALGGGLAAEHQVLLFALFNHIDLGSSFNTRASRCSPSICQTKHVRSANYCSSLLHGTYMDMF